MFYDKTVWNWFGCILYRIFVIKSELSPTARIALLATLASWTGAGRRRRASKVLSRASSANVRIDAPLDQM
jgi:hypothetical protein